jgi:monoamine oxidase
MRGPHVDARRRALLLAGACAPLAACAPSTSESRWSGGWIGADAAMGHRLRDPGSLLARTPDVRKRAGVLVVGGGIAGLGAARALVRGGVDDVHLLELEGTSGGNSRGHVIDGIACPLGAHYLPLPGPAAIEVIELLEALGLRRTEQGNPVYDERTLCHSPQERLWIDGAWHEGLLPSPDALPEAERAATLAEYRRFDAEVDRLGAGDAFAIPTARAGWGEVQAALDRTTFAQWLDAEGYRSPALRWYLDYCCRDDYGAGAAQVSAWAGIHYFASRHGFRAPGGDRGEDRDGVLTWPEGNAWLARRLAAPLQERLHTGRLALRVEEGRHEVTVDAWDAAAQQVERWTAAQVVLAVPVFVAARIVVSPSAALMAAAAAMRHAPWLVANLHLGRALDDRPGVAPAWDNVAYGSPTLGYVDAAHQSLLPYAGATVLTAYWALGGDDAAQLAAQRKRLLDAPWRTWGDAMLADLAPLHPDLAAKVDRIDLMRYGHAMSVPVPGVRGSPALAALADSPGRLHHAHADLSGYSIFEEALYHGTRAARAVLERLRAAAA